MVSVEGEGGADFSWTGEQVVHILGFWSTRPHVFESGKGFGGADEDGAGFTFRPADDVGHPMVAVGEVRVEPTGRAEHDPVARGLAAMGVTTGVVGLGIGFDFDETDAAVGGDKVASEEEPG